MSITLSKADAKFMTRLFGPHIQTDNLRPEEREMLSEQLGVDFNDTVPAAVAISVFVGSVMKSGKGHKAIGWELSAPKPDWNKLVVFTIPTQNSASETAV